jgi:putative transposase
MRALSSLSRAGPPHNPGLRELIIAKRTGSLPVRSEDALLGFAGWHERGYLPHRDAPGLTQFVTLRLADSYPRTLRSEWEALLRIENDRERRKQLEAYLDKGRGQCTLREPRIAGLVDEAFRFYHGWRYDLHAWVVMPNHVHALFTVQGRPLSSIMRDLKGYTARQANRLLRRRGRLWAEDYWDTYMRDSRQELRARRYIESNPVKALLARDPTGWPWSSARFRDENGVLHLQQPPDTPTARSSFPQP